MLDLRNMLPVGDEEEEGEEKEGRGGGEEAGGAGAAAAGAVATPGGGLQVSGKALRNMAPRTAAFLKRFRKLNEALVEVLEDYNLVSFRTLSCREEPTVRRLLAEADRAIGFVATAPRGAS